MQKFLRSPVRKEIGQPYIGVASTDFAVADVLYVDTDGYLALCPIGAPILGWCNEIKTTTSTNASTELYKPQYIPAEGVIMAIDADGDVTVAYLDGSQYKDFGTVTSGAFEIALGSISGGQVKLLGYDPYNESDDDLAICCAAEPQKLAFVTA